MPKKISLSLYVLLVVLFCLAISPTTTAEEKTVWEEEILENDPDFSAVYSHNKNDYKNRCLIYTYKDESGVKICANGKDNDGFQRYQIIRIRKDSEGVARRKMISSLIDRGCDKDR